MATSPDGDVPCESAGFAYFASLNRSGAWGEVEMGRRGVRKGSAASSYFYLLLIPEFLTLFGPLEATTSFGIRVQTGGALMPGAECGTIFVS